MAITFSSYFQTIPGTLNKLHFRLSRWPLRNGAEEKSHFSASGAGWLTLACARVSSGTVSILLIMVTPVSTLCWAPSRASLYTGWINKWNGEKMAVVPRQIYWTVYNREIWQAIDRSDDREDIISGHLRPTRFSEMLKVRKLVSGSKIIFSSVDSKYNVFTCFHKM